MAVEYGILGPLELRVDGHAVEFRGGRQRALLTILLLHANEVVSSHRLIDALWHDDGGRVTPNALEAVVSRLRRALSAFGSADDVETVVPGYVLRVPPERLDLARFEALRRRAQAALAAGSAAEAVELLTRALDLWRGEPLAEFAYEDFATNEAARLSELRLLTVEE